MNLLLAACAPVQTGWQAVAAKYFPTASATPTLTPTITATPTTTPTPTPTLIPTATLTPTSTATPALDALVVSKTLKVYDGPGTNYKQLGHFNKNAELYVQGQFSNCAWLKVSNPDQTLAGWISGNKKSIDLQTTCADIPIGTYRPLTGLIKSNQNGGGYGQFTVENGNAVDGVVILTLNNKTIMAAYIRAGKTYTMKGIRDQTYNLYFSTGSDWNGKEFLTAATHRRFEDSFKFTTKVTTTATTKTTKYTIWRVSLQPVKGGKGKVDEISGSDFPDLENTCSASQHCT